jgi:Aldo/keto reductase family
MPQHFSDARKLEVVEQLVPLAEKAGLPMTHLAMAFAIAHPGVTSAIIGPRTMEQVDDLLADADVTLDDELLDRINEIAPPGSVADPNDVAHTPSAISSASLRRRPPTTPPPERRPREAHVIRATADQPCGQQPRAGRHETRPWPGPQ